MTTTTTTTILLLYCTGLVRRFGDDISYTLVCFAVINKYTLYTCAVETTYYGEKGRGGTHIYRQAVWYTYTHTHA